MSEPQETQTASGPGLAGRGYRKVREGLVVSDKMDKTIVVEVEDRVKHGLYGKVIRRTSKLKAHDEQQVAGRLPDDDAVHAAALTFVSDLTLLSAGLARIGGGWGGSVVGASLDHAVWFHRPVRADEWFLYETDSPAAASGRALCFGQIWAADGTHVATAVQEGLIRSLE